MIAQESTTEDSTVEQVLSFIRERIINGQFPPQSKLFPKQIADSCGTSFIPVREALRTLESEGFVQFVHNRGAWVTPLSVSDLEDLYVIRMELECEAVRRADRFSKAEIASLAELLEESLVCNKKREHAKLVTLNRELHFFIYRKSNSPRRLKLIEQLWLHSARYQRMSLDYRHDAADAEHRKIISKLRRGDHDGAAEALRTHLQTTVDLLREGLQDTTVSSAPRTSYAARA